MIFVFNCSMLECPLTSDYDEINNGVSETTVLEPLIDYRKSFSIRDISAFIFCPLLTKLHTALRPRLIYFIKYFIGGSNTVVSETPLLI